ncbi:protein of unknown function [Streptomyces murinus]
MVGHVGLPAGHPAPGIDILDPLTCPPRRFRPARGTRPASPFPPAHPTRSAKRLRPRRPRPAP